MDGKNSAQVMKGLNAKWAPVICISYVQLVTLGHLTSTDLIVLPICGAQPIIKSISLDYQLRAGFPQWPCGGLLSCPCWAGLPDF